MDVSDPQKTEEISKWDVNKVCEFIRKLPGCADYADDFALQEMDGQALLLLKAENLMQVMNMKLGTALKVMAKINELRTDNKDLK